MGIDVHFHDTHVTLFPLGLAALAVSALILAAVVIARVRDSLPPPQGIRVKMSSVRLQAGGLAGIPGPARTGHYQHAHKSCRHIVAHLGGGGRRLLLLAGVG
jgi:hypothetical protein